MIEYRFLNKNILCGVWNGGMNGTVILASGLPQYIDKYHPFLKTVEELGLTLIVPRYMGTWESSGDFSLENCVKTIEETIDFAKIGKSSEMYGNTEIHWNTSNLSVLGFSFGALPTLLANREVDRSVLCPFVSYDFHYSKDGKGEYVNDTFEYLQRAYPNIYRFSPSQLISDLKSVRLRKITNTIRVGVGNKDNSIPPEEIEFIKSQYQTEIFRFDMGHSLQVGSEQLRQIINI